MNIEDIDVFLAIYRCHNISRAANELFLSQSSTSYKLSVLETELGVKLFSRQKGLKNLSLTPAGENFLPIALKMHDLNQEALRVRNTARRTRLLVAGVDSVNGYFLIDFYQNFVKNHPDIELKVINGYSYDIINKVEQDVYDIGISNDSYNFESIHSDTLFSEEYVCLKRCKNHEKAQEMVSILPQDLNPKDEVYQGFDTSFIQWHKIVFPQFCPKFITEIVRMTVQLMDTPGSWSIMPYTVAKHYHDTQACDIYRLSVPPPPRTVYITTNIKSNSTNSRAILLFKEELLAYINSVAPLYPTWGLFFDK